MAESWLKQRDFFYLSSVASLSYSCLQQFQALLVFLHNYLTWKIEYQQMDSHIRHQEATYSTLCSASHQCSPLLTDTPEKTLCYPIFAPEKLTCLTWMLGAKPPSSPTFVASWPYFFLIMLCIQNTLAFIPTAYFLKFRDIIKRVGCSPWGGGTPQLPSSWPPWTRRRRLGGSWTPECRAILWEPSYIWNMLSEIPFMLDLQPAWQACFRRENLHWSHWKQARAARGSCSPQDLQCAANRRYYLEYYVHLLVIQLMACVGSSVLTDLVKRDLLDHGTGLANRERHRKDSICPKLFIASKYRKSSVWTVKMFEHLCKVRNRWSFDDDIYLLFAPAPVVWGPIELMDHEVVNVSLLGRILPDQRRPDDGVYIVHSLKEIQ